MKFLYHLPLPVLVLFWTPFLFLACIQYRLALFFRELCFEKGWFPVLTFNLFLKFQFACLFNIRDFNKHFISSLNLKGDSEMGKLFGLKPNQAQEFEPKGQEDIPYEERLIFLCKFLDVNMSARISDQVYSAKGFGAKREELLRAGTQEVEILRQGLVGWRNFAYEDGEEIEWVDIPPNVSKQKAASAMDQNLNKIPPELRGDIADFIRGASTPDQD